MIFVYLMFLIFSVSYGGPNRKHLLLAVANMRTLGAAVKAIGKCCDLNPHSNFLITRVNFNFVLSECKVVRKLN
jgi:hypothetical protein